MKHNLGRANLDELRNSFERQKLCDMYFKYKKKEFEDSKVKLSPAPFTYTTNSSNKSQNHTQNSSTPEGSLQNSRMIPLK